MSIFARGLLQSAETTTVCHNMHLTQDPQDHTQNEVSSKTFQWRCAASVRDRSAVCGALCATRPTQKTYTEVCLNHRRSRYKTTKHARSRPHSNVRQAWIVSGAINISTRTYITHHQQGLSAAAARDDPRQVLFTPCQTQIMDRNKLEV